MSNNIFQVAKMLQRQGKAEELPYQLDSGEFGFATDTLELFIGVGDNPKFENRTKYPYGNLRILTELSEPLEIQKYTYEGNTDIKAMFPIIYKGTIYNPIVSAGTAVKINGVQITFDDESDVEDIVSKINNMAIPYTNAYSIEGYLVIVSTDNNLKIENVDGTGFLQTTGLTDDPDATEIGQAAEDCIETTIQKVLDEYLTIKHFNVQGNGTTDDTDNINKGLLGAYCVSDSPSYLRTVYFPAGEYILTNEVNIPCNARLLGEGKGRTVFKAGNNIVNMIGLLDQQKKPSNADEFGGEGINPYNITVEGFTFDGNNITETLLTVYNGTDITFRDCEFKNASELGALIKGDTLHITFDNCDFDNTFKGIDSGDSYSEHLTIINCHFKNLTEQAIVIGEHSHKATMINNCFMDCAGLADEVVLVEGQRTALFHSKFDDAIEEFTTTPVPYTCTNDTIFTDILNPSIANEDMVYKFNFPQPQWGYVDSLRNKRGEYIIKPVYEDESNTITNWLYIKPGDSINDKVEIYTEDQFKEVYIGGGQYANIIIGDCSKRYDSWIANKDYVIDDYVEYNNSLYKCKHSHTSVSYSDLTNEDLWEVVLSLDTIMVVLGKNLNLNGHYITNTQDKDIELKPEGNAIVKITDENYPEKIDQVPNAVATVEFVKSNIASKSLTYYINMDDMVPSEDWSQFDLATLTDTVYSDTVYIKSVSISVENIFRKYDFENMLEWESEMVCYKGMAVKHNGSYYVAKETNASQVWVNAMWEEIDINKTNPNTIRLYGIQNGIEIDLVPVNTVKLYEKEDTFPENSTYYADAVQGNVYNYHYSRHTNVSNYTLRLEITDENGIQAENFQPSGKLFITVDLIIK